MVLRHSWKFAMGQPVTWLKAHKTFEDVIRQRFESKEWGVCIS